MDSLLLGDTWGRSFREERRGWMVRSGGGNREGKGREGEGEERGNMRRRRRFNILTP